LKAFEQKLKKYIFFHLNASGIKAEIHEKARGWLLGHPPDQSNCHNILKAEACRSKPVALLPALPIWLFTFPFRNLYPRG
jgi:hypothetical protein